jgi:sRNA-binding carbon storage regulator CsrA
MLAFTRRPMESFIIGENIVVRVLGRDEFGNIQFGIDVAKSFNVQGKENISKLRKPG